MSLLNTLLRTCPEHMFQYFIDLPVNTDEFLEYYFKADLLFVPVAFILELTMHLLFRRGISLLFFLSQSLSGAQGQTKSCAHTNGAVYVPPRFSDGNSIAQFTSCSTGHDGPKIAPINNTVYEWWHFNAVSEDATESLTVVYYTSSFSGFPFDISSMWSATTITLSATFADGSSNGTSLFADRAEIITRGDGASGTWVGAGSFTGASDLLTYDVCIDAPHQVLRARRT